MVSILVLVPDESIVCDWAHYIDYNKEHFSPTILIVEGI